MNIRSVISTGLVANLSGLTLKHEPSASLGEDQKNWWSKRSADMESANTSGNFQKWLYLIRFTGIKRHDVSKRIYEADKTVIRGFSPQEIWTVNFSHQFN